MANCCNADRTYMGTGRCYMRQPIREAVRPTYTEKPASPSSAPRSRDFCGCSPETLCENLPLATSYMAPQPYIGLVCAEPALSRGSSFDNLYDPRTPGGSHCQNLV